MAYTLKSGSEGKYLEEKYVKWEEVGLTGPDRSPGTIWMSGWNGAGQLGQNDMTDRSSPVQVGSLTNWAQISGGYTTCVAIKTDGTLWGWGGDWGGAPYGVLGLNGSPILASSPIQIGSLTNWSFVSGGRYSNMAIKTDGTLWAWGYNSFGNLGLNTANDKYSSPVQVGSLTNWKVVSISSTGTAIKTDGTLWCWGRYSSTGASSPVQVGTSTDWKTLNIDQGNSGGIFAIKNNGTLWCWGNNNYGVLGLNTVADNYYSPVQVGALTNWSSISSFQSHTIATKTDGTLWAWGAGGNGELGLGYTIYGISSPVQVGSLTNWKTVAAGNGFSLAIKTDGTLWGWGSNSGQLGLNDMTSRSSPVQIGSLTKWKRIRGMTNTFSAMQNVN